jgi:hypothetical protein
MEFQLLDVVVNEEDVTDEQKSKICKKLGEADKVRELNIITLFYLFQ